MTKQDGARILVIDDNPQNVELLESALTLAGYEVFTALGGEEGLEKARSHLPDLILLDVLMPDMDGYEVCIRLRKDEATRSIPVVMLTALKGMEDKVRGLEVGADDFLSKPFHQVELMARVRSLLRVKRLHDELEERNRLLASILNRYMSEEITARILDQPERYLKLGGETRLVTVLFADIKGFTSFAEEHSASRVVEVLNTVFSHLTQLIFKHKGTFDKYLGDAIMAFYGAPISYEDDVLRALQTALEMQEVFEKLRARENLGDLGLGIGIHTGEAVVGNIGSEKVMDYTVIGDTPNVARRLQELAGGGQIFISQATYQWVKDQAIVEEKPPQVLRGKQRRVMIYELKGLKS